MATLGCFLLVYFGMVLVLVLLVTGVKQSQLLVPDWSLDLGLEFDNWKSVLFCEYLGNKIFDLYEIWNLSSLDNNELPNKILWTSVRRQARRKRKPAHARKIIHACIWSYCMFVFVWMFIKILLVIHIYPVNLSFKFNKDPNKFFQCSDWKDFGYDYPKNWCLEIKFMAKFLSSLTLERPAY